MITGAGNVNNELANVGRSQYAAIVELIEAYDAAEDKEEAETAIFDSPLSVRVRSCWYDPARDTCSSMPAEYELLMATGGPAARIRGDLDENGSPTSARLEVQDWGTPWTPFFEAAEDVLLRYATFFYYGGEG